jgi:hypothetical protein
LKQPQLIQILSVNAQTLAERHFHAQTGRALTRARAVAAHEKGGVRIAEAASRAGNAVVLAS